MHKIRTVAAGVALICCSLSCPGAAVFQDRYVDIASGVRAHALVGGTQTAKPTVIFIPGWRLTANVWLDQMARLAPSRRVIAVDSGSQGESKKPA